LNIFGFIKNNESVELDSVAALVKKRKKIYVDLRFLGYYIFKVRSLFDEGEFNNSLEIANEG